jgi:hypothetical protein
MHDAVKDAAGEPLGETSDRGVEQAWFAREPRHWTVIYGGTVCRLKDSKGLHYLAVLLSRPGELISAVELAATQSPGRTGVPGSGDTAGAERARLSVIRALASELRRLQVNHPALWNHLQHTVRMGKYCAYVPDARLPIHWNL